MNTADIKEAISKTYPLPMTYKTGQRLQIKSGRHRRSYAKSVGFSSDHILSVELIGPSKKLRHIEFMFGLHDPAMAAYAALAAVASIRAIYPDWDDEDWLKGQIEHRLNGSRGKVTTKATLMPMGERPFTVVFIKVVG